MQTRIFRNIKGHALKTLLLTLFVYATSQSRSADGLYVLRNYYLCRNNTPK